MDRAADGAGAVAARGDRGRPDGGAALGRDADAADAGDLAGVDPGFHADGLMAVRLIQAAQGYDGNAAIRFAARARRVQPRDRRREAGDRLAVRLHRVTWAPNVDIAGPALRAGHASRWRRRRRSRRDISRPWGFRCCAGANFGRDERPGAPIAAIVNQTFVEAVLPRRGSAGRRVSACGSPRCRA